MSGLQTTANRLGGGDLMDVPSVQVVVDLGAEVSSVRDTFLLILGGVARRLMNLNLLFTKGETFIHYSNNYFFQRISFLVRLG